MKTKQTDGLPPAAILAGALLLLDGCGTTAGYKQADKTGAGIAEFRVEILNGKSAIEHTVQSLDQIAATANTNPRKAFEQFSDSLRNLESAAAKAQKRGQEMKVRGQEYFKQWEQQIAGLKNPDIRKLAEEQRAKLQSTFDSIRQYSEPLRAQFDPWLSDLKDLQKYLSNDLSIGGVDAAKSLFAKTRADGTEVQKSMDALVAELNTVAATLTPANVKSK